MLVCLCMIPCPDICSGSLTDKHGRKNSSSHLLVIYENLDHSAVRLSTIQIQLFSGVFFLNGDRKFQIPATCKAYRAPVKDNFRLCECGSDHVMTVMVQPLPCTTLCWTQWVQLDPSLQCRLLERTTSLSPMADSPLTTSKFTIPLQVRQSYRGISLRLYADKCYRR